MAYIQMILAVIELVKLVEKLFPESGQGTAKLALVRQLAEQAIGDLTDMWPTLESVIAAFVKLANLAGTFKK